MKFFSNAIAVCSLLVIQIPGILHAQQEERSLFIGVNPSLTIEPYYTKGEFDVNALPFVVQRHVNHRIDMRINPVVNVGFMRSGTRMSHVGFELAAPLYLDRMESLDSPASGFFLAPVVSATRNYVRKHDNLGLWLEPGYHLPVGHGLAFSFGVQFGTTYFDYFNGPSRWGRHFGVKVVFGRWF